MPQLIANAAVLEESEFQLLRDLIYDLSGIRLADHKLMLLQCRLQRRLRALGMRSFAEYYHYLVEEDKGNVEKVAMLNAISTNTTHFFREDSAFLLLRERVLREFHGDVRLLSAGCSTGEEPYTIAIVAHDELGDSAKRVTVDACDINTEVLAHARRGIYNYESVSRCLSDDLMKAYFLKGVIPEHAGKVMIHPTIKASVRFFNHNLMAPIKTNYRYHTVFCRNVAIYFDRQTQHELFERLLKLLVPGGYLVVGHAESMVFFDLPIRQVDPSIYIKTRGL